MTTVTFTTPGTFTWTAPPGTTTVQAECWGAGGGAQGAAGVLRDLGFEVRNVRD